MGEWFGYQCFGDLEPDLLVVGKGINGCALPVGGVVASRDIGDELERSRWWSGSTHDAHPLVAASVVGALETMLEHDLVERAREMGTYVGQGLAEIEKRHACVGRVAGRGLFYAVDLVDGSGEPIVSTDRWTTFGGDVSQHPNNIIASECAKRGVFLGGFVPNTIKVGPPLTITPPEIDAGLEAFDEALSEVDRLCG